MGRICAVGGCHSGRNADNVRRKKLGLRPVTIFTVPKKSNALQAWSIAIGKELFAHNGICEFHFPNDSVIREDKTVLRDGTVHIIPRQKYGLVRNAVPIPIAEQENIKPNDKVANCENEATLDVDTPVVEPEDLVVEIVPDHVDVQENVPGFADHSPESRLESPNHIQEMVESDDDEDCALEVVDPLREATDETSNQCSETDKERENVQQNVNKPIQFAMENVFDHLTQTFLPETWCWARNRRDKNSIVFVKIDQYTFKLALRLTLHKDLTVTAHTADGKVDIELDSKVTSIESLDRLLNEVGKRIICSGTGMDDESRDGSCAGFVSSKRYVKQVIAPRCELCRKLRLKIQKRWNKRKTALETWYKRTILESHVKQRARKRLRQKTPHGTVHEDHRRALYYQEAPT